MAEILMGYHRVPVQQREISKGLVPNQGQHGLVDAPAASEIARDDGEFGGQISSSSRV